MKVATTFLVLFAALWCASGCASTREAEFPGALQVEFTARTVNSRLTERGIEWTTELYVADCKDQPVIIRLYGNGATFLAEETATPPYENSHWKSFSLFVPLSRLASVVSLRSINLYATMPDAPNSYIGAKGWTYNTPWVPSQWVWSLIDWTDSAEVPGDGMCFQFRVRVDLNETLNGTGLVIVRLRDTAGRDLRTSDGNPFVTEHQRLNLGAIDRARARARVDDRLL